MRTRKRGHTHLTKPEIQWNAKYNQLRSFYETFGHCNVPNRWDENTSLGFWVVRQRAYREYLSAERIDKLESIGFIFNIPDYKWNVKYKELEAYYSIYGHSEVPKSPGEFQELGEWVSKQRIDYKKNRPRLTPEKIEKLNKLNFYWGVQNTSFEQRLEQLKLFKLKYSHCRVPQKWEENPSLASWVSIQRKKYKQGKLSSSEFNLLDSIGFIWKLKKI